MGVLEAPVEVPKARATGAVTYVLAATSRTPARITHDTPAAACAGVGGQGYLAASVDAWAPVLSTPPAGGPTIPVRMANETGASFPWPSTGRTVKSGSVHPTGTTAIPAREIRGWFGLLLHSVTAPTEFAGSPKAVTVIFVPVPRQAARLTDTVIPSVAPTPPEA